MEKNIIVHARHVDDLHELVDINNHPEVEASKDEITLVTNPPPMDMCCETCGKHVSTLEPFWDNDPMPFVINGHCLRIFITKDNKLLKHFREFEGHVFASWECINCYYLPDVELKNFPPKDIQAMIFK